MVAVLGVMTLMVSAFLLYSGGAAGLAQGLPQVEMSLAAQPVGGGVVEYSLLLLNHEEDEEALDEIRFFLPQGQRYVGLTAESEVGGEPSVSQGALIWAGPFVMPGGGSLALRFWAVAVKEEASGLSRGVAYVGGAEVASAEVEVAPGYRPELLAVPTVVGGVGAPSTAITVTKSVSPESTLPSNSVKYTAVFSNSSVDPVVLSVITDTFSSTRVYHVGAAPESDIEDKPDDPGNPVAVWTGPYTVTAGSSLTLAYWAWVGDVFREETVTNTLQAEAEDGSVGPVTETLDIEVENVFFPLVMKELSLVPPASLEDHFDANAANWTPFLNYWRLSPAQWYWQSSGGYQGGCYRHNMNLGPKEAHDALSMYLGEGAQEWTDYRFRAKVNMVSGVQLGVWFRGTFVNEGGGNGRKLTGYYFLMSSSRLILYQMRTENECGDDCVPAHIYHFSNPILLKEVAFSRESGRWYELKVEVEGSRIKCYVDDVLKIEYNDTVGTTFLQGTVGFFVYKAGDARFDDVLVEPF